MVYTAKMMYGILDRVEKGFFKKHTKIVAIHTGGLQGNFNLKERGLLKLP
jgi:1-aminocyclopropane-1-carboxylate deaminase